jgi:hypothetical protein
MGEAVLQGGSVVSKCAEESSMLRSSSSFAALLLCALTPFVTACPKSVASVKLKGTVDGSEVEETLSFSTTRADGDDDERFVSISGSQSITLHHIGESRLLGTDTLMFVSFTSGGPHVGAMQGGVTVQGAKNAFGVQQPWVTAWRYTGQDQYPTEIVLKKPRHVETDFAEVADYEIRLRPDCSDRIFLLPAQLCGNPAGNHEDTYEGVGVALPESVPAELLKPVLGDLEGKKVVFERAETVQFEGAPTMDCAHTLENNKRVCGGEQSGIAFNGCGWTAYAFVVPFFEPGGRQDMDVFVNAIVDDGCELVGERTYQAALHIPVVLRE